MTPALLAAALAVAGFSAALALLLARRRRRDSYEIVERLGSGELSGAYRAVRRGASFVLKIPDVPGHDALAAREFEALAEVRSRADVHRAYFPEPAESFLLDGRRVNAFAWREGFLSAEELLARGPLDGRHVAWMFNRALEALGAVHRAGWVHGAALPPHLLYHPERHALLLVGWIHAVRIGEPLRLVPARYADDYPPEVLDRDGATPSVDLWLAAASMLRLAGDLPAPVRRFFRGCLLASPRMRPQDAWRLRDEFGAVLEEVYGPPAYHPLKL